MSAASSKPLNLDQFQGFTPGPWWLDDDGFIAAGSQETYCTVAEPRCMEPRGNESEIDANASLIAAAPSLLAECRRLRSKSDFVLRLLGTLAARNQDGSPCFCDGFASGGRSHTGHCVSGRNAIANEPVQPDPEAELTRQREEIARLRAALEQAAASLAVACNHAGSQHPGLADADNLNAVRGFCFESFLNAGAALAANREREGGE